jgi:hypothetical protein
MNRDEIIEWLESLTEGTKVYIDDDGMCLKSTLDPDAYLEVGGHTPTAEDVKPVDLAVAFCEVLNKWLTPDEIREVNRLNATSEYTNCCATHNYCDSNQAMLDALEEFGIEGFDANDEKLTALINEAWELAIKWNFNA